jgi:hypothetical protein
MLIPTCHGEQKEENFLLKNRFIYLDFFQPSLSTEELHAEMKNLEGLMKDLTSINNTSQANKNPSQFNC